MGEVWWQHRRRCHYREGMSVVAWLLDSLPALHFRTTRLVGRALLGGFGGWGAVHHVRAQHFLEPAAFKARKVAIPDGPFPRSEHLLVELAARSTTILRASSRALGAPASSTRSCLGYPSHPSCMACRAPGSAGSTESPSRRRERDGTLGTIRISLVAFLAIVFSFNVFMTFMTCNVSLPRPPGQYRPTLSTYSYWLRMFRSYMDTVVLC